MSVAVARMKKYVPLVLPWFLPSVMFSVVVAAVHSWKTDSLQFAFLFVVLPLAIWTATIRSCSKELHDPVFAPSFVTAVLVTDIVTFVAVLRPAISIGLEVAFVLGTVNLLVLYWRVIQSDPGRFPVFVESSAWDGGQERDVNSQFVSGPRLEGWTAEDYEGEPLKAKDPDIEKGESHQSLEKSQNNEEVAEGVVQVPNDYYFKRLPARSRYCRKCNAWIDHFDHHCPAIKNCVGRKNHVLFLGALAAFIVAELLNFLTSYLSQKILHPQRPSLLDDHVTSTANVAVTGLQGLEHFWFIVCQVMSAVPWVTSTAVFAAFQVSWQIPLLLFHVYCASANLTTAEWIKWERYPDLYIEMPLSPGRAFRTKKFVNPYNQGVVNNLKQFLRSRV